MGERLVEDGPPKFEVFRSHTSGTTLPILPPLLLNPPVSRSPQHPPPVSGNF